MLILQIVDLCRESVSVIVELIKLISELVIGFGIQVNTQIQNVMLASSNNV